MRIPDKSTGAPVTHPQRMPPRLSQPNKDSSEDTGNCLSRTLVRRLDKPDST